MSNGLEKYQRALKKFKRENPNVSHAVAQQKVSAAMKSGTISGAKKKKRRVGAAPAARKAAVTGTRRKTVKRATVGKAHTTPRKISGIAKATKLVRDIERLEIKRREARARELKDVIQVEINKLHDQLDALKGHKRKSA
jgi:hypothetical protein